MKQQTKGCLTLLLTAMIWGAAFVAQSEGMQYVGPFTMQATRFFLAGLVLLPVIFFCDRRGITQNRPVTPAQKKRHLLSGIVCGLFLFGGSALQLVFAVLILALGVVVVVEGIKALSAKNNAAKAEVSE